MLHYKRFSVAKFKRLAWLIEFFHRKKKFEFEWDDWNSKKILNKHGFIEEEIESAFFDPEVLFLGIQVEHDFTEDRFGIIAKSKVGIVLFISFTIRRNKIRVISARKANKTERSDYET